MTRPDEARLNVSAPLAAGGGRRWGRSRGALLWFLAALVLYTANGRPIATGDSLPARFIPFAILGHGTVLLDPVADAVASGYANTYWIQPARGGRTASLFPVTTPVLVTPLYVPAAVYLAHAGWTDERLGAAGAVMEKTAASIVAALAVGLMYVVLRRSTSAADACLLTGAFAAGTGTWTISSQALWQHGVGELALAAALVAVTAPATWRRVVVAGAAAGILAANRPLDGLLAIAVAVYALTWARTRTQVWSFTLAASLPVALVALYNLWAFGTVWGGYGATGHLSTAFFSRLPWEGIAGQLISPGKGLFVYAPFFLFLFTANPWRGHPFRTLTALLGAAVAVQIVLYAATDWRAGFSYGPRFLTDALPVLVLLLVVPLRQTARRPLFVALVAAAVCVQAIGAFKYAGVSDLVMYAPDQQPEFQNAWRPSDSPILIEARQPFASMTLLEEFRRMRCAGPSGAPCR